MPTIFHYLQNAHTVDLFASHRPQRHANNVIRIRSLRGRSERLEPLASWSRIPTKVVVLEESTSAMAPPLARPLAPRMTELLNLESPLHHSIRFHSWSTRASSALHNARPPCVWKRVALCVQFSINVPLLSANDACTYLFFVCVYVGDWIFISNPFFPSFFLNFIFIEMSNQLIEGKIFSLDSFLLVLSSLCFRMLNLN